MRNASATLTFTPGSSSSQVYAATLTPPLQFQPGDLLGATFYSASGGGLAVANEVDRSGYLVFRSDASPGTAFGRDTAAINAGGVVVAMEAASNVSCEQLPPPEIFLPAVGDVVGAAHFTTDVVAMFRPNTNLSGSIPVQMTVRDRMGGNPRIASATVNAPVGSQVHPSSLSTTLGIAPPYFGSLLIAFGANEGISPTASMMAAANITAATATCGGGGTGSVVQSVACSGIGRLIAIPFHIPANHRLNIGIASAQMHSCGIFAPATSAEVWINDGPHVIVPMPGESTQIGDITGAGAAPYGSAGFTDGIVYIRVADEATRIVGYASLLDNSRRIPPCRLAPCSNRAVQFPDGCPQSTLYQKVGRQDNSCVYFSWLPRPQGIRIGHQQSQREGNIMDGTTLLYSQPTWPGVDWHDDGESLRRVESFEYLMNLMKRPRMGDPIERIIIEAPVDGSQFMLFLTQLPPDFRGDVLYIDRADRGILSAAADDSPRVLYSLEEADIHFYTTVNRLTRKSFQPRAVPAPAKPEQMRVLLAEDEPRTREILTGILTGLGCHVSVAKSGLDALRKTHEERPNVLLLDGLMPEMHGFEVARYVRGIEANYRPRIIVITAVYKNTRYQNEARMKYGVDGYLVKPVTPEQIGDAVFGTERNQPFARIAAAS